MRFSFSDEQEQFRDMVGRFFTEHSATTEVRRLMETDSGFDPSVWTQLSEELGLAALQIPAEYGGAGFGSVELGIVMEEMGRTLACVPYLSSAVLATHLIVQGASEQVKAELLPRLADGSLRGTFALVETSGSWDLADVSMLGTEREGQWRLNGAKRFVLDGHSADFILVATRAGKNNGLTLFVVEGDSAGLSRTLVNSMDSTRKIADLDFEDTVARPIGALGEAGAVIADSLDLAAVALANEMVGGAQALLKSAVEYAKMRVQFGRSIGSFQAIKHKCADMLLDVESARSAAYCAAEMLAEGNPEAPAIACLAKAATSETYVRTAAETIQIHGGIGFTWENDTQLWFKRAKSSEVLLGDPSLHRERLMQRWGH
jgi:alkylation response protein AidB-like acyl-CoA dehydrogenase